VGVYLGMSRKSKGGGWSRMTYLLKRIYRGLLILAVVLHVAAGGTPSMRFLERFDADDGRRGV